MIFKWLLASCALACASVSALAQPAAKLEKVQGVVLATQGQRTGQVTAGKDLADGARVVTTSNSSVTLQGPGGCSVSVPPGHAVTVGRGMSCQQLKVGVSPVIPDVAARSPTAPPPAVLDRLRQVGASPVAIGVLEQLTDEPLSAR
jgi:hypothetical protein